MIDWLIRDGSDISKFDVITALKMGKDTPNMLMHVGLLAAMDEQTRRTSDHVDDSGEALKIVSSDRGKFDARNPLLQGREPWPSVQSTIATAATTSKQYGLKGGDTPVFWKLKEL
tara:strand:+ start:142 stop:486 length:345 start_codon:yes stop_codon:yes gene_type:complete